MNKAQLIDKIANASGMTKAQTEKILDITIDTILKSVKKGEDVKLMGFGTFTKSKRAARKGVNPQTGEELKIAAAWYPKFRAGEDFKSLLNK